eukprot:TRINITY_DN8089_c0_g1_i1.p1 TRINITY_DN8089_c0_g1~~TRINITY_DN8089_c0_g1_i1.p1  ORF type:complete len:426 (+),score=77.96 TRINITY_DN8089_c0_g1_i1:76-1353(+)
MEVPPDRQSKYAGVREPSPEWIGFGSSSSKRSGGNPHGDFIARQQSHQSEGRNELLGPGDTFELREQNYHLRQYLSQMEADYSRRISELEAENKSLHDEMLNKCEAKIMAYRERTEEEIEKFREDASKSRDKLHTLQELIRATGVEDPDIPVFPDDQLLLQISKAVKGVVKNDQADILIETINDTVSKSLGSHLQLLTQHRTSIRQEYEKRLLRSIRAAKQQYQQEISSPHPEKELFSPSDNSTTADKAVLKEDLELERQKSAMVCIKMKESLEKKNKLFEEAVMKKADDLVNKFKGERDTAIEELEQSKKDVEHAGSQTDPISSLTPQQLLAKAVSTEYRKEHRAASGRADPSADLSSSTSAQFEKEVMEKAHRLLHKYSGVVGLERKTGTEPKPLPSIRNYQSDSSNTRLTYSVRSPSMAMYP